MKRTVFAPFGVSRIVGFALAMVLALVWGTAAHAQSADDQYGTPTSPSGPLSGESVSVLNDTDGVANAGDVLLIEGDFTIAEGSSVTLQDADGTQGTLIDGVNAQIVEGSVRMTLTGDPVNVSGGDGVLGTDGLTAVASTGISASSGGGGSSGVGGVVAGVLPSTGGSLLLLSLGGLAISGAGLVLIGRRPSTRRQ